MQIQYACLSVTGPVRPHNEDSVSQWIPTDLNDWRGRGAVTVLCDGVGGQDRGEVASHLASDTAVGTFRETKPGAPPSQMLFQIFNAANPARAKWRPP
jgi:protein phosphatase